MHMAGGCPAVAAGLAAVSIGQRGGPGWRVTSAKRLRRLVELLGDAAAERWRGTGPPAVSMRSTGRFGSPLRRRPVPSAGVPPTAGERAGEERLWQARARGRAPSW